MRVNPAPIALDINLDDLILDDALAPRTRGRERQHSATYLRDLNAGDMAMLAGDCGPATPVLLQKIRHAHHLLARLVAEGRHYTEVAQITGYSPQRVSELSRHDPAFQELVAYYRQQSEASYLDVHQRLATLGVTTLEELQDRMEEAPEKFTNRELTELMEAVLDRGLAPNKGQGAGATSIQVTFVDPPKGTVIDISPERDP